MFAYFFQNLPVYLRFFTLFALLHLPLLGGHNFGISDRVEDQLTGIDVSHHQKRIDWEKVVQQNGIHFAFVKATEGADFMDSLFCYNWESLAGLGLHRGAYHFFRPGAGGYQQALHFLSTVNLQPGDLPPVLDVELTDGVPPHVLLEEVRIWLITVERAAHTRPIIYTNQDFYDQYFAGLFDHYPLWVARYSWAPPALSSGRRWNFWQFSNRGTIDGIEGYVDLNIFRGNPEKLNNHLIGHSASQQPSLSPSAAAP